MDAPSYSNPHKNIPMLIIFDWQFFIQKVECNAWCTVKWYMLPLVAFSLCRFCAHCDNTIIQKCVLYRDFPSFWRDCAWWFSLVLYNSFPDRWFWVHACFWWYKTDKHAHCTLIAPTTLLGYWKLHKLFLQVPIDLPSLPPSLFSSHPLNLGLTHLTLSIFPQGSRL